MLIKLPALAKLEASENSVRISAQLQNINNSLAGGGKEEEDGKHPLFLFYLYEIPSPLKINVLEGEGVLVYKHKGSFVIFLCHYIVLPSEQVTPLYPETVLVRMYTTLHSEPYPLFGFCMDLYSGFKSCRLKA